MSTSVDSPPPMPGGEGSLPGGAGDNDLRRDLKAKNGANADKVRHDAGSLH